MAVELARLLALVGVSQLRWPVSVATGRLDRLHRRPGRAKFELRPEVAHNQTDK